MKSFKKISSLIGLILLGGGASAIPLITGCAKGGPHGVVQFDSFSRYEKYVKRWLVDTNEYKTIDNDNENDLKWLYDNLTNEDVSFFNTCWICWMLSVLSYPPSKITVDFDNNWNTTTECEGEGLLFSTTWYKIPDYLFHCSIEATGLSPTNSNNVLIERARFQEEGAPNKQRIITIDGTTTTDCGDLLIPSNFWTHVTFPG